MWSAIILLECCEYLDNETSNCALDSCLDECDTRVEGIFFFVCFVLFVCNNLEVPRVCTSLTKQMSHKLQCTIFSRSKSFKTVVTQDYKVKCNDGFTIVLFIRQG